MSRTLVAAGCVNWHRISPREPMQNKIHENAREPLEEILELASAHPESPAMREIAGNARCTLGLL